MDLSKAYHIISLKLQHWLRELIAMLPNMIIAIVILMIGFFLSRMLRRVSRKIFSKFVPHPSLVNLLATMLVILIGGIAIFTALSIVKLDKAVTTLLAGAGVVGLALAFAFQDIAANFVSGIFLTFRRPIAIGDIIRVKDFMGVVEKINLRDTVIRTFQGHLVIIPNKDVFQNPVENYSTFKRRRFDLPIGISYAEDLEKVKELTLQTVAGLEGLDPEQKTTFVYTEFGESTINFTLRLWVAHTRQADFLEVCSQAIIRIKKAFEKAGVDMPFPIRTLDFKMKGGATLADMLTDSKSQAQ